MMLIEKENNQELPFLQIEFSGWTDQLEEKLITYPGWRELLVYRGISVYDSAYSQFYWEFLQAYRDFYSSYKTSIKLGKTRHNAWFTNLTTLLLTKKLLYKDKVHLIKNGMIKRINDQLPSHQFPIIPQGKRALVVRAYQNKSGFPILSGLRNTGWNILFASWNEKLEQSVKGIGIPYLDIKRFYRNKYQKILDENQERVKFILGNLDCRLPGQLLGELSGFPLEWDAQDLLLRSVTQVRTKIDIYQDLLDQFAPDIVVLFNENSLPGRTMANVAQKKRIPSVAIQHGLFIGDVYRSLATDKVIVWGEIPRKFWLDRGCRPEQVISVGAYSHEKWSQNIALVKSTNGHTRQRILFLGQNPAGFISQLMHKKTIDTMFQAVQKLPEYDFVIRPHPGESSIPYETEFTNLEDKNNVEVTNQGSIDLIIQDSDLIITVFSTAGLEAMLLKKPVVVLDLSNEPPMAPFACAAKLVRTAEELPTTIHDILENPDLCQQLANTGYVYAESYFGSRDGHSIDRAVRVINELAGKSEVS